MYNEEINDLLQTGEEGRNLRIVSDDPIKGPVIGGLTEEEVHSEEDIMSVIQRGEQNRSYGSTQVLSPLMCVPRTLETRKKERFVVLWLKGFVPVWSSSGQMNDNSSRSHTLYRLIIESKEEISVGDDEGSAGGAAQFRYAFPRMPCCDPAGCCARHLATPDGSQTSPYDGIWV